VDGSSSVCVSIPLSSDQSRRYISSTRLYLEGYDELYEEKAVQAEGAPRQQPQQVGGRLHVRVETGVEIVVEIVVMEPMRAAFCTAT